MRDKTRALEVQSAKVGLKINATKTKLMRIDTKRDDGVSVAGERVEEVDESTYLGSIVSNKGCTDEDIQARIGKAKQAFAMLRPIWRSTALTTKTKLRVFGSTVKAVLLYGSETWRLTKGLEQKLQVFINKSLRNILRIWWPRKISNKELWNPKWATTDRGRYKTASLELDRPQAKETRWTCSQEGTGVEPTGEAKEKETPAHLETQENGGHGGDTSYVERGKRHSTKKG